jgi:hypothetical protein
MKQGRFAVAINCFDGRAQVPPMDWLRSTCGVDYIDVITEPGAVKCLSEGVPDLIPAIRRKVQLALKFHAPTVIAVVGHHDCLANPVSKEEQWEQIRQGVRVVDSWGVLVRVVGLYVNEWRSIDLVSDTQSRT